MSKTNSPTQHDVEVGHKMQKKESQLLRGAQIYAASAPILMEKVLISIKMLIFVVDTIFPKG